MLELIGQSLTSLSKIPLDVTWTGTDKLEDLEFCFHSHITTSQMIRQLVNMHGALTMSRISTRAVHVINW